MNEEILLQINEIKQTFNYSIDDGFTTIVGNKELSKGCQCCKNGSWLCIIIGTNCNLNCNFCKRTEGQKIGDYPKGFGVMQGHETTIERLDVLMQNFNLYKGVSYTGGEPLMYIDRILEWSNHINKNYPQIYQWIYTNGTLATENKFQLLVNSGIKEIRFNLAATNYSEKILQNMKIARNIFPVITVEVPVINSQFIKFKSVLNELDNIGIDHINLHNLLIHEEMRIEDTFTSSTLLVYDMLKEISQGNYNFNAHDCTMLNNFNQGIGWQYQYSIVNNNYKGNFQEFKDSFFLS